MVRPEAVEVPAEVTGSLADGAVEVDGVAGSSAAVPVEVSGLVGAVPSGVSLQPGRFDPQAPRADADTAAVPLTVPGGTEALRVQLEGHRAADDMDVYLYRDGVLTALATGKSSDETLTLVEPPAGDYTAYVVSASAANGTTTTGQLYTWVLPPADAGNLTGSRGGRRGSRPVLRVPADLDRRAVAHVALVRRGPLRRQRPAHPGQPALRPSRRADSSRISTLRILPVTVIGNSSTTST